MVVGKLPVPGHPTLWITVGQGPTALTVSAGGGCLDIFTLLYPFSPLSPSLWETAQYRLKYCHKGPFNPKQPTNQPMQNILIFAQFDKKIPNQKIYFNIFQLLFIFLSYRCSFFQFKVKQYKNI